MTVHDHPQDDLVNEHQFTQRRDDRLSVADRIDPLRFFDLPETAGEVVAAMMRRVDAASALVYAMHDASPDFLARAPANVRRAYEQCCAAYRPNLP